MIDREGMVVGSDMPGAAAALRDRLYCVLRRACTGEHPAAAPRAPAANGESRPALPSRFCPRSARPKMAHCGHATGVCGRDASPPRLAAGCRLAHWLTGSRAARERERERGTAAAPNTHTHACWARPGLAATQRAVGGGAAAALGDDDGQLPKPTGGGPH